MNCEKIFDISDKIAVVTGAGGELAGAISRGLASCGAKVAILDLDGDKAKFCAEEIKSSGGTAHAFECDVLDEKQLLSCNDEICRLWGCPDYLLNGAGGNHPKASTEKEFLQLADLQDHKGLNFFNLDMAGIEFTFALNFYGTFLPSRIFTKGMVRKGSGSVINISSMNALTPLTKIPAYSAAKSSISNFTKWMSVHFSKVGIRVNAIAPGFFMTEQLRFLHIDQRSGEYTPRAQKVLSSTPMERYGEPNELLGTAVWLFSDASSFVTGTVIPVDGGFSSYAI